MEPETKQRLLEQFHPDYRSHGFREIRVGPNKGQKAMNALANTLSLSKLGSVNTGWLLNTL